MAGPVLHRQVPRWRHGRDAGTAGTGAGRTRRLGLLGTTTGAGRRDGSVRRQRTPTGAEPAAQDTDGRAIDGNVLGRRADAVVGARWPTAASRHPIPRKE